MLSTLRSKLSRSDSSDTTEHSVPLPEDALDVAIDEVFDVIANSRRRLVIHRLARDDGKATTRELAEYVAAVENNTDAENLSSQERKRVYIGLYQTHIPAMADAGIIECNGHTIKATRETRVLADAIEHVETVVTGGDSN